MLKGSIPAWWRMCLTAAFLLVQSASLAHAAEYGDHPHKHDGVQCELTAIVVQDLAILPAEPATFFHVTSTLDSASQITNDIVWRWPPERGPPPRSPPSNPH